MLRKDLRDYLAAKSRGLHRYDKKQLLFKQEQSEILITVAALNSNNCWSTRNKIKAFKGLVILVKSTHTSNISEVLPQTLKHQNFILELENQEIN